MSKVHNVEILTEAVEEEWSDAFLRAADAVESAADASLPSASPPLSAEVPGSMHMSVLSDKKAERAEKPIGKRRRALPSAPAPRIGFLALLSIVYFLVCGGAYGLEDLIGTMPPLLALSGLVIIPWIWSLPLTLITAELAMAFPHRSGFVEWTRRAWGPYLGFMDAYQMVIVVVVDQAVYPVLFVSYMGSALTDDGSSLDFWPRWGVCVTFVLIGIIVTLLGARVVGYTTNLLQVVVLAPLVLMALIGFANRRFEPSMLVQTSFPGDKPWRVGLYTSVLIWATCGFEYAGTLLPDVKNARRNFCPALTTSMILMTVSYLLPLMAVVGTWPSRDLSTFTDGDFVTAADHLRVGAWLGVTVVVGGLLSTFGAYLSYLHSCSESLRGLAEHGYVPKALGKVTKCNGAPYLGILSYSASTVLLVLFDFDVLVQLESFLYCLHVLCIAFNVVKLGYTDRHVERPFRIYGGLFGRCLVALPLVCVSVINIVTLDYWVMAGGSGLLVLGTVIYLIKTRLAKRRAALALDTVDGVSADKLKRASERLSSPLLDSEPLRDEELDALAMADTANDL